MALTSMPRVGEVVGTMERAEMLPAFSVLEGADIVAARILEPINRTLDAAFPVFVVKDGEQNRWMSSEEYHTHKDVLKCTIVRVGDFAYRPPDTVAAQHPPSDQHRAVFCEHANESPAVCSCKQDCYCKDNTCKTPGNSGQLYKRINPAEYLNDAEAALKLALLTRPSDSHMVVAIKNVIAAVHILNKRIG